jgi:hypothetical protein
MLQKSTKTLPIEHVVKTKNTINSRIVGSNLPPMPYSFSKRGSQSKQFIEPLMVDNVLSMGPTADFFSRKTESKIYNS